jgi:hypothetical protein
MKKNLSQPLARRLGGTRVVFDMMMKGKIPKPLP